MARNSPTITQTDLQVMSTRLATVFSGRATVLGSQLGAALRAEFPDINPKSRYQNLRDFVAAQLSGTFRWAGKRGLDDMYELTDIEPFTNLRGNSTPLWPAYTNPNVGGTLFVRTADHCLIFSVNQHTPPEGHVVLRPLASDDYREIAKRYIGSLPEQCQEEAAATVSQEGAFWNSWLQFIRRITNGSHVAAWEQHRIKEIESHFAANLASLGLSETEQQEWMATLHQSRRAARRSTTRPGPKASSSGTKIESREFPVRASRDLEVRDLLKLSIDQMSMDELRRLSVPFGAIIDAINRRLDSP